MVNSVQPAKSAPQRLVLDGRYARLEPIALHHAADLYAASIGEGVPERYRWLFGYPPASQWSIWKPGSIRPCAIADETYVRGDRQGEGRAVGAAGLDADFARAWLDRDRRGLLGPAMARSRVATEALYLFASHAFDDLGYRRFEWKCNDRNEPSKAAAKRFGFVYEGVFRQDRIVKGENRDTAWFSMIDGEWPALRAEYERWLAPENFASRWGAEDAIGVRAVGFAEP